MTNGNNIIYGAKRQENNKCIEFLEKELRLQIRKGLLCTSYNLARKGHLYDTVTNLAPESAHIALKTVTDTIKDLLYACRVFFYNYHKQGRRIM